MKNKIIVILGPTASGKTGLAVDLALEYNGEIVSADSRQVYKGMDIGSGKDLPDYHLEFEMEKYEELKKRGLDIKKEKDKAVFDVPYHLIDVVDPNTEFSLGQFYSQTQIALKEIIKKDHLPIIAGGTGLWLQAVVDGYNLTSVKADNVLRDELEKLTVEEVFEKLKSINNKFAEELNNSEKNNKRRLIRYIEILSNQNLEKPAEKILTKSGSDYEFLIIGLKWPKEVLHERIYKRLIDRLENQDMIGEVSRLNEQGVSWKRLEGFGLEYKFIALYLQEKIDYDAMLEQLTIATRQFAKKQMSWFRRWEKQGTVIHWVEDRSDAGKLVKEFLLHNT
ncbi:MAG: tRNA (adenosine(37)-N6)-dimethylallyltransferase MiaA [Candidatus Magasanikbacteria bacterium]|nr:tRNA (adenosine(37)-N6)-dimethylallyltransferase MiaA [Candidatus Magasanikbacteria bacterium]